MLAQNKQGKVYIQEILEKLLILEVRAARKQNCLIHESLKLDTGVLL